MRSKMIIDIMLEPPPMTSDALPRTAAIMGEVSVDRLIKCAGDKEDRADYSSLLDWRLISVAPRYKHRCLLYYAGKGPPLTKLVSARTRRRLDRKLSDLIRGARGERDEKVSL